MAMQLAALPAPALVVLDGEIELTALAADRWPGTPIHRCWWHLPHRLRKTFYTHDAANRHVNPHWAWHRREQLGELLHDAIRHERTTDEAPAAWDTFTQAHPRQAPERPQLSGRRPQPRLHLPRPRSAGPPRSPGRTRAGTGVLECDMREINARTGLGARPLEHRRAHRPDSPFTPHDYYTI